jgi:hypothetical protein
MAALSKLEIIKKYPIGEGLDALYDSFISAYAALSYCGAPDALQQFNNKGECSNLLQRFFLTCTGFKNLALDLFLALQNLSVARFFPSSNNRGTLRDDLFQLNSLVLSNNVNVNSVVSFIEKIIDRLFDEVVLNTVFAFIVPRAISSSIF